MKITNTGHRRRRGVRRRKGSRRNFRNVPALRLLVEGLRRIPLHLVTYPGLGPPTCSHRFTNTEYVRMIGAIYAEPPLTHRQVLHMIERPCNLWVWMAVILWPYIRIIPRGENCKKVAGTRMSYFQNRHTGTYGMAAFSEVLGLSADRLNRLMDGREVDKPAGKPMERVDVGTAHTGSQQVVGDDWRTLSLRLGGHQLAVTDALQAPKQAAEGVGVLLRRGCETANSVAVRSFELARALLARWLELEQARLDGRVERARKRRVRTLSRKGPQSARFRDSSAVLRIGGKRRWLSVRANSGRPSDINKLCEKCAADILKRWPNTPTAGALDIGTVCDDKDAG